MPNSSKNELKIIEFAKLDNNITSEIINNYNGVIAAKKLKQELQNFQIMIYQINDKFESKKLVKIH